MHSTTVDSDSSIIIISDTFDITSATASNASPTFSVIGEEVTFSFLALENISKLKSFSYDALGVTDTRYLTTTYRLSRNNSSWTPWMILDSTFSNYPPLDPKDLLYVDIKFTRSGTNTVGVIKLIEYEIQGLLDLPVADGESTIKLEPGAKITIKSPFVYKVFKITDIELIAKGATASLDMKYRFSQDVGKLWSQWEPLTKENISTVRINPIRFFLIEYLLENKSSSTIYIYDLNLIGDFQNVSQDYFKTNLLGIRECCQSQMIADSNNGTNAGNVGSDGTINYNTSGQLTGPNSCSVNIFAPLTDEEKSKLFNPYQQDQALELLNKISNDTTAVFGHKVDYFATNPDKKGIDYTFHEYQLYNYDCYGVMNVSVDNNQFPDSQIAMNQFDLALFDSFEVHITKQDFKQVFGPHRRPAKEDFMWFCDLNRMFIVEHAQAYKNFNNASVYYKIFLKKWNQKANVIPGDKSIADKVRQLAKNSTIDELFGIENDQDKESIANKDQFKTLTKDPIRLEYFVNIEKELIENSVNIISKSHYDMSSVDYQSDAIVYRSMDNVIKISDNISYTSWFSINNYTANEIFNLITHYDIVNNLGYQIDLQADVFKFKLNDDLYEWGLNGATFSTAQLEEEVWYCYLINVDQRQRKINQYLYKRNVEDESEASSLPDTKLKLLFSVEMDMNPVAFEFENIPMKVTGSDMKLTNIRIFTDIIPVTEHNKILNQAIIRDSQYLVFADNANTRLTLPNYPLNDGSNF